MNKKGIVVAGTLIADIIYETDTYPDIGRLTNIREVTLGVGGSGNMILDFARMDAQLPIKVSAILGEDDNGRYVRSVLGAYPNIDLRNIVIKGSTATTLVMEPKDTNQRTFFYLPGGNDEYDESYINWEALEGEIFHLEYLLLMKKVDAKDEVFGTHAAKILHRAKKRGMKISIDIVSEKSNRVKEVVSPALQYTDYCIINEIEAEAITEVALLENGVFREENIEKALLQLKNLGVSTWAVIHSPHCGYGLDCKKNRIEKVPSLRLPSGYIKGTTGAGDAYCAGVLYAAYHGETIQKAMEFGTACAACSLSELGGSAGIKPHQEMWEVYRKYRGETDEKIENQSIN